jgi:hypothetical protein
MKILAPSQWLKNSISFILSTSPLGVPFCGGDILISNGHWLITGSAESKIWMWKSLLDSAHNLAEKLGKTVPCYVRIGGSSWKPDTCSDLDFSQVAEKLHLFTNDVGIQLVDGTVIIPWFEHGGNFTHALLQNSATTLRFRPNDLPEIEAIGFAYGAEGEKWIDFNPNYLLGFFAMGLDLFIHNGSNEIETAFLGRQKTIEGRDVFVLEGLLMPQRSDIRTKKDQQVSFAYLLDQSVRNGNSQVIAEVGT